ncbi:MAG TPA: hypothetical protein VGQ31_08825 [Candidatus Limnocylindrales bacterium]|jgi:hypothetical protein|nr:hypothetical protein [Candidatus Limnocylindrales bacterium]
MSISRLIRLAVVGWIVSMIVGAIAAMKAKQAIGPDTDESADRFSASAIFGPLAYHSTAAALRDGQLECWYGGGVLDLRDATLAPEGATLRVRAIFGGGQILVPAGWRVVTSVRGLGGVSDTRPVQGRAEDAPELSVEGMVFAGGFAIMSELDHDQAEWLADMEAKPGHGSTATNGTSSDSGLNEPEMTPAV